METRLNLNENIASGQKIPQRVGHSFQCGFLFPEVSHLQGVLHSSSLPDYIEDKKSGGQQQSNLFPVSAGSDLRMSPLRPNPYLSIGIDERRSEKRDFLQLFSRTNL
jgi:hypothetical protein